MTVKKRGRRPQKKVSTARRIASKRQASSTETKLSTIKPDLPILLSVPKVAKLIDSSPATVRALIREDKLQAVATGAHKKVVVASIHAWIAREISS